MATVASLVALITFIFQSAHLGYAAATTVAGLPEFMVLKAIGDNWYLHYLWNDEFGDFYKFMGARRELDPVNPFVKLEVVPSTTSSSYVHLRCSYNNKFLRLVSKDRDGYDVWFVSPSADSPNEATNVGSEEASTLFEPIPASHPLYSANEVYFRHVVTNYNLHYFSDQTPPNPGGNPYSYQVLIVYSQDPSFTTVFEFAPWESFKHKMRAKDQAIEACDVEVQTLTAEVAALGGSLEKKKAKLNITDGLHQEL